MEVRIGEKRFVCLAGEHGWVEASNVNALSLIVQSILLVLRSIA